MQPPSEKHASAHWLLAGKALPEYRKRVGDPEIYHPLFCHMADVAAVAEVLWDEVLPEPTRSRLASAFGLEHREARTWVAYIAGLHDIGKASPAFQVADEKALGRFGGTALGYKGIPDRKVRHWYVSEIVLVEYFEAKGVSMATARTLASVLGGHHGIFPAVSDLKMHALGHDNVGQTPWEAVRRELFDELTAVLGVPELDGSAELTNADALTLAGITTVADWIGSADEYFPYEPGARDATAYLELARGRARRTVDHLHWLAWSAPRTAAGFRDVFPFGEPYPVQQACIDLAADISGPALVIVEAPMGEGKTEAAIWLADQWNAAGEGRGTYFALPTAASSNQMFGRVREYLERRYDTENAEIVLQLLHGASFLDAEFEKSKVKSIAPQQIEVDGDGDKRAGGVVAAEWFSQRKRGLLAPYGVGTIDQALMAVLQSRHNFVRLFGLTGKPVVIDEVHAYDTYMSSLLERLLEWLAALGSPVVLLSATLTPGRREALGAAYARGLGVDPPRLEHPEYPRLSWISRETSGAKHVEPAERSRRSVHLEPLDPEPAVTGAWLKKRLPNGCAAVICNTVARAQKVYEHLRDLSAFSGTANDGDPTTMLLHGRFRQADRKAIEDLALRRFGKGADHRPDRAVIVATQVIEQSLDLDFDVMVSDLAPIDLVIQRSGRLHRHARTEDERHGMREPVLALALQATAVDVVSDQYARPYDAHTMLRSWLELRDRMEIRVPGDLDELVEAVYEDRECPDRELGELWEETLAKLEADLEKEEKLGRSARIATPYKENDLAVFTEARLREDEPDAHQALQALTRLAEPSVEVIVAEDRDGVAHFPDGGPVPVEGEIRRAEAVRILGLGLSVSHRGLRPWLAGQDPPAAWRRSAYLRHYRLLAVPRGGSIEIGRFEVSYSSETGLAIDRAG